MAVFCGIDWSDDHHDVALVDDQGTTSAEERIPVAIETDHGLLVTALRATGRSIFAINPLSVSRYRDRHSVARRKSDAGDALVLAHLLRTDMSAHRPLPNDTDQARAVAVLARAQQDAAWDKVIAHNRLRAVLHQYFPALLTAFPDKRGGIMRPEGRALLSAAPTPALAARLTRAQLVSILRRAGRVRQLADQAEALRAAFRQPHLRQPQLVEVAMGRQALALLRLLDAA
jgi:transposase